MRITKALLATSVFLGLGAAAAVLVRNDGTLGRNAAHAATPVAMMAMPVPVTPVVRRSIPVYLDYSARTESIRQVALQAKVSGYVQLQAVPDGADVKPGDLLYRIDPRDFQAALDQARAQALRDAASLDYARSNYRRGNSLAKDGWLARDAFDQRTSTLDEAQAALVSDQAAVRMAQLNLDHTEIHAAFAGRIGRDQAPVGTLVSAGGTVLNTLVQLDPIYVTFDPSETELAELQVARARGPVPAEVLIPGQDAAPHRGELTFIDTVVDRSTGTIVARATIRNADRLLLPGQYVRIRLHIGDQPDALLVPQVAVGSSQLGKFVYVVGASGKAELKLVTTGDSVGSLVAVHGVSAGDRVITGNLQKIGPGAPVHPIEGGKPQTS